MTPQHVRLKTPCPGCGFDYAYLTLDTSDPEAEEWPIKSRCARCRRLLATTSPSSPATPSGEVPSSVTSINND